MHEVRHSNRQVGVRVLGEEGHESLERQLGQLGLAVLGVAVPRINRLIILARGVAEATLVLAIGRIGLCGRQRHGDHGETTDPVMILPKHKMYVSAVFVTNPVPSIHNALLAAISTIATMPEWSKGHDSSSCGFGRVGSNPTRSS